MDIEVTFITIEEINERNRQKIGPRSFLINYLQGYVHYGKKAL